MATEKYCPRCFTFKPHDQFYKSSNTKDCKQWACKRCQKALVDARRKTSDGIDIRTEYRRINRDKLLAYGEKWRTTHRENHRKSSLAWYHRQTTTRKERIRAYQRQYRAEHREQCCAYSREYYWRNRDQERARNRAKNAKYRTKTEE